MAKKPTGPRLQQTAVATKTSSALRKSAVVTGASSGIGRELALLIAERGFELVLVGRDRERLDSLAHAIKTQHGSESTILPIDLTTQTGAREVYEQCSRRSIVPEILVNNAGVGLFGPFADLGIDEQLGMIQLNITTLTHLTRLFVPGMIRRRSGFILNVASTAAFQPGPLMAGYYASKSYVVSLTIALAQELKGSGVSASVLCPGPTKTEFHARAGVKHTGLGAMAFMSAREVANTAVAQMLRQKTVIIPGFLNKVGAIGVRLLPMKLAARMVQQLHQ